MYPWKKPLTNWASQIGFKIDALGLVTMLGADEVDANIGRLVSSDYVEFLPLVGPFVLASNSFTKKQPGFTMYNLSDGIVTNELSAWLSRWLQAQDFGQVQSVVYWKTTEVGYEYKHSHLISAILGFIFNGALLVLTILSSDWWGFANAISMVISILVRHVLLSLNRSGLDKMIKDYQDEERKTAECTTEKHEKHGLEKRELEKEDSGDTECHNIRTKSPDQAKLIVTMDDSKVVTMWGQRSLIKDLFTKNPKSPQILVYRVSRWLGWVAFIVHYISLGMATLPTQIYTVIILGLSSILTCYRFGCDDSRIRTGFALDEKPKTKQPYHCRISSLLEAYCTSYTIEAEQMCKEEYTKPLETQAGGPATSERRQDLFVWLQLKRGEIESMKRWNLLPSNNSSWWNEFDQKRSKYKKNLSRNIAHDTLGDKNGANQC